MSPELEQQLFQKFPLCFAGRDAADAQFEYGIMCGDGWYELIETACQQIEEHLAVYAGQSFGSPMPRIVQIKEKAGSLRINLRPMNSELSRIRQTALLRSQWVCEECGAEVCPVRKHHCRTVADSAKGMGARGIE